jgi:hypothetical protein
MNVNARGRLLLAGTFILAFVACSGGANRGGTMPPTGITGHGRANATLTITIPRPSSTGTSSSNSRGAASVRPDYISTNTQSMSIAIDGGTPQDFGLTNTSPGCSGNGSATQCTITVAAPVGTGETWAFTLYSTTNETGTPLSLDTEASITITAGVANNLGPYTLNPVVGSYSVAWSATPSFTANSSGSGTIVLTVKDPSGATIIGPGSYETSAGSPVTFSLSDNLPNSAPFTTTSQSYALSFTGGSGTAPASSAPSNVITVAYGGLSVPATTFYVNDSATIQATNSTSVSEAAVLGTPVLTATCANSSDLCSNGTASTPASVSFVTGGDNATLVPSEPGWTDAPYSQAFTQSANTCTGGTFGSTLSGGTPTWTLTANTGNNPGTCSVSFEDSASLAQTVTANASYTYTSVIVH